jgi:hypothetical protein
VLVGIHCCDEIPSVLGEIEADLFSFDPPRGSFSPTRRKAFRGSGGRRVGLDPARQYRRHPFGEIVDDWAARPPQR